jgi:flagellar hook-basal body complex protein FliE
MAIDSATIALARMQPMQGLEKLKSGAGTSGASDFSAKLDQAVETVSKTQNRADDKLQALASGEDVDIHNTMIALQEADIALRTMVSVRDKVVEAYQTVMNMTI